MVDRRCRESEGKAKIEGYMSVSDEEAHQWIILGHHISMIELSVVPFNTCFTRIISISYSTLGAIKWVS